jgi:V/A-type H+-transporting ATPase subunit A
VDAYAVPEKQVQILLLMMTYYEKSLKIVKSGCPLIKIMELPVRNEIIRAKSEIPNDKLDELVTIQNHLDDQMAELERMYRKDIAV